MNLKHSSDGSYQSATSAAPPLLAADELPPFEWMNPQGTAGVLLVCDHASNRIPRTLEGLGLSTERLAQHIAWDPGAAEVARGLALRLDAPLIMSNYSRLVIDLNRPLASPESIPERSDGVVIPGNVGLGNQTRFQRIAALFDPYHRAIAAFLAGHTGRQSTLLSIHSFSPVLGSERRPWQAGVAYGRDRRLTSLLLPALRRQGDVLVGENLPYGVDDEHDHTLPTHGEGRGIAHAMIEMRQDELATATGIAAWVDRLANAWDDMETEIVHLPSFPFV
jgi:predicted N-formylglutamate amidohydrolase